MPPRSTAPPGWPPAVPAPDEPGFEERATAWLLDQGPPELRSHPVLRRHPVVLSFVVRRHVGAQLTATRGAYGGLRRELAATLGPEVIAEALETLEREGARLVGLEREVGLVDDALRGRRWRPRL